MTAGRRVVRAGGLVAVIAVWWIWSDRAGSLYFPPLPEVMQAFADNWLFERVQSDLVPSLVHMFVGFGIAAVVGIVGGLALGLMPTVHRALQPTLEFLRAMPPPVFLSFGLLVLGTGPSMQVVVIALGPVWPILLNTIEGVRGTDVTRLDTARVFGLSRVGTLTRVIVPSATPRILAGLRVGLPLALVLMVISELIGSTEGVGYFVIQSSNTFAIADMWSGIVLLGLIGWSLASVMALIERVVLELQSGDRGPKRAATTNKEHAHV